MTDADLEFDIKEDAALDLSWVRDQDLQHRRHQMVSGGSASTTFDQVMKNKPFFIANTAKHYLFIKEIGKGVGTYLSRGARQGRFPRTLDGFPHRKGNAETTGLSVRRARLHANRGGDAGTKSALDHLLDGCRGPPR